MGDKLVNLSGSTIRRVSGYNAKWIKDNKINVGSIVRIIKSGEIIPKVIEVIRPSTTFAVPKKSLGWVWDKNGVDIILPDAMIKDDPEIHSGRMVGALNVLGVKGVKSSMVWRIYEAGITTQQDFLMIPYTKASIKKVHEVLGDVTANKFLPAFKAALEGADHATFMEASACFPRGWSYTRFAVILSQISYSKLLKLKGAALTDAISAIPSIGGVLAQQFTENFPTYVKFLNAEGWDPYDIEVVEPISSKLKAIKAVFTGFRDAALEDMVTSNGGEIQSGVNDKTTHLVMSDTTSKSSKTQKAQQLGVKMISRSDFTKLIRKQVG